MWEWLVDLLWQMWVAMANLAIGLYNALIESINEAWAWLISPLYDTAWLRDLLPSQPGLRAAANALDAAAGPVQVVWWLLSQVADLTIVAVVWGAVLAVALVVWLYRAYMAVKRAIPLLG